MPVFWVGLPSIRGPKATADVVYLNELYRTRAERAGITYIDVWDGFVDDNGRFVTFGPDYEGQTRRLRSGDGVFFTKYGARKLAHFVEREIRRLMANRGPIALPAGVIGPAPGEGKPAERPLAGPVLPLTVTPSNSDVLLGGAGSPNARGDAIATQVLIKGEPVSAPAGRADDFIWPRGSVRPATPPPAKPKAATPVAKPTAANTPPAAPHRPRPQRRRRARRSLRPRTLLQPRHRRPRQPLRTSPSRCGRLRHRSSLRSRQRRLGTSPSRKSLRRRRSTRPFPPSVRRSPRLHRRRSRQPQESVCKNAQCRTRRAREAGAFGRDAGAPAQ